MHGRRGWMHTYLICCVHLCCRSFCQAHKVKGGCGILEAAAAAAAAGSQQGSVVPVKQRQQEFLGSQRVLASLALGRHLLPHEAEALVYPRLCEVCGGAGQGKCCGACHCVYYCSELHCALDRARHSQWCGLYSLCVLCDCWSPTSATTSLVLPAHVDTEYQPLPSSMPAHLAAALGQDRAREPTTAALLSEQLSFPLTAMFVLESTSAGLAQAQHLSLHLVGAEENHEPASVAVWEYLLHRLPCLTRLHILLVGPQLTATEGPCEALLCRQCQEDGRELVIEGKKCLYHQFMAEAAAGPPDLRVAFNCGFHEWAGTTSDTWSPSLALMVADDTPLAFTSYTCHEAERDMLAVRAAAGSGVTVVMARPNPYQSLRPLRDWNREDDQQLYHNNQYLTVVQGSQPAMAATTS